VQLTQAEGDALIEHLVETGKRLIDPLPQESEHDRLLNAVLADTVTTHLRDKVVAFIVSSAGCDVITQIELAQFKKYLQEMRNLITDPQVFEHLLEQTLASTPVSA
jgi:hypothetical protein